MGSTTATAAPGTDAPHTPPQRALRRHLTLVLLVKFAALALLWLLCFSPAHRTRVDSGAVAQRVAAAAPATARDAADD